MLMKGKEVYHNQLLDLAALLGPAYSQVGVGRDDGEQAGEYSPIFYNGERLRVVKWKTLWLSPTPDVPGSKGWDAVRPRLPLVCHGRCGDRRVKLVSPRSLRCATSTQASWSTSSTRTTTTAAPEPGRRAVS